MASAVDTAARPGFRFPTGAISGAPAFFTSGVLAAAEAPGVASNFFKHTPLGRSHIHTQLAADAAAGPGFQFPSDNSQGAPALLAFGAPAAAEAPGMAAAAAPLSAIPVAPVPRCVLICDRVYEINSCHRPLG